MEKELLLKNKSTYLKLILLTGLTGGYNFYLDKNKKALKMMTVFISLLIGYIITLIEINILVINIFCFAGIVGFTINSIIWLKDLIKFKTDIYRYNDHIEMLILSGNPDNELLNMKTKSKSDYKLSILLFGILGLEDLYLEKYSLKSVLFIINNFYVFWLTLFLNITYFFIVAASINDNTLYTFNGIETLFVMMGVMLLFLPITILIVVTFPWLPIIMVILAFCRIISKLKNAEQEVSYINSSLMENINKTINNI